MKFFLRLFLLSIALFGILIFSAKYVSAQTYNSNTYSPTQNQFAPNTNPDVPQNFHNYSQSVVIELLSAFTCQLAGVDPTTTDNKCLGIDLKTKKIGYIQSTGGAIGFMGNMIGMTFNIPISSSQYIAYLGENFGLAKKTYAETGAPAYNQQGINQIGQQVNGNGIGFNGFEPVRGLWIAFRNIVYLIFVLVTIVIGVAIMFRINIDPKTVMTIQNQIPKIIIGLVLVTFSYAIAGFLVDLMYVMIYIIFGIFMSTHVGNTAHQQALASAFGNFQGMNPLQFAGGLSDGTNTGLLAIINNSSSGVSSIITSLFQQGPVNQPNAGTYIGGILAGLLGAASGAAVGTVIAPVIGTIIGGLIGGLLGAGGGAISGTSLLGVVGQMVAWVIIAIALLSALFRLWFKLLSAYLFILLDVVFGPFIIMSGVLPGGKGISTWLRDLLANLAAFPVAITMFLLADTFMRAFSDPTAANGFIPPLIGNPGGTTAIGSLIGLGMILMTPEALKMTRDALKAPDFKYTSSIGQAFSTGQATAGAFVGGTWGQLWKKDAQGNARGPLNTLIATRLSPNSFLRRYLTGQARDEQGQPVPRRQFRLFRRGRP